VRGTYTHEGFWVSLHGLALSFCLSLSLRRGGE
jgi:hypothetical protein